MAQVLVYFSGVGPYITHSHDDTNSSMHAQICVTINKKKEILSIASSKCPRSYSFYIMYSLIALDERVTFGFDVSGHSLVFAVLHVGVIV